jgi:hypothetical protein
MHCRSAPVEVHGRDAVRVFAKTFDPPQAWSYVRLLLLCAGQKRKCPGSRGTSVLPTGADIVSLPRHVRWCHNQTHAPQQTASLLDHLVCAPD